MLLHQEALAGNYSTVKVLLEFEADPIAKTRDGKTPLQLARSLGWERVAAILIRVGAK
jgi:ankyrin repeat protein